MDNKLRFLILGAIPGGIMGWMTKPLASLSAVYSSNPQVTFLMEIAKHVVVYAAVTGAVGFVIGYMLDSKEQRPPTKPKY